MRPLEFVTFACALCRMVLTSPVPYNQDNLQMDSTRMEKMEELNNAVREQAIEQLLEVFGMPNRPQQAMHRHSPPQFMVELYRSIADDSGITRAPNPYHANIIRSFPDKGQMTKTHFFFNVSTVPQSEDMLQAELHLFKLKPKGRLEDSRRQHFFEVHIHQLLSEELSLEKSKMIGARLVGAHGTGWEVFSITPAVKSWREDPSSNHGLMVTVSTMTGITTLDNSVIRFAKKKEHHSSKQPILVTFTNDDSKQVESRVTEGSGGTTDYDYTYDYIMQTYGDMIHATRTNTEKQSINKPNVNTNRYDESIRRKRQATEDETASQPMPTKQYKTPCSKQKLYVDFEEIGWSGWIISPRGYNAYHCKGECPFPLGQTSKPTNHATVQSIVNALKLGDEVAMPCCVPDKLFSISLLYFDEDDNVVLKQYDDMVAASCGCH
ncbi:anti dorsalizing morphogenetic protein precursor [Saccoglossus kowalevskii]|uniref:Anti dorsalizing morphogenetic protein n=1 Tax=Saccoglossus kowalevskii TaxID=10224 RepID=Q1PHQ8_SACKO|nr:anti dorsalizing morphogenetic protein precursor [Saccoglossus kowalevskii]ABD97271.1 anti dorsalizing morphogenetic protein [Saccoglossus kowalevskii]